MTSTRQHYLSYISAHSYSADPNLWTRREREGKRKIKEQQAGLAVKKVKKSGGTKKKSGMSFGATGVLQVNPNAGGGGGGGSGGKGGRGGKGGKMRGGKR